jgi:broad specificity phosphatase PhoE
VLGAAYVAGRDEATPLSPTGEMQAQLLGARLAAEKFSAAKVFASHAARAHRTAELVCESAGIKLPITTDERVVEFSAGAFEKQKRAEAYTPAVLASMKARGPFFRPPGHSPDGVRGESQIDVQARMDDFLDDLLTRAGDEDAATCAQWAAGDNSAPIENVVVVAHGIAIRAFIRGAMGASHDFAIHSDIFNTSVCELVYKPITAAGKDPHGGWRLVRFNDHAHLQQEVAQGRLTAVH